MSTLPPFYVFLHQIICLMNKLLGIVAFFALSTTFAQIPCESGSAGPYPCDGYDLLASISLSELGGSTGNDSWGWTDPSDNKEYAITGVDNGTVFIDITDPINPVILGKLPGHNGSSSLWRDIKVYDNHAFIVSEDSGHGMQVFDLTRLRNVSNPPETFTEDAHYNGFGNAHNIVINEETGFAYAVGTNTFSGGPHFINIQSPTNPTAAGGYSLDGYTHDAQVVIYNGPDTDYTGKEIYIGCNTDEVVIVDVTDKSNPQPIANFGYSNVGYTHQGWLTEDQTYFLFGDEFDESNVGFNTRTVVFDFTDLDNPQFHFEYFGPYPSIDHNGYVKGDKFYLASYSAGLSVIDISDIENQNMFEIGLFDTHPANQTVGYTGAWNVYPYFESGNIIVSNIDGGFFIVRDNLLGTNDVTSSKFSIYPNPARDQVQISANGELINTVNVYNMIGQLVVQQQGISQSETVLETASLKAGIYIVEINNSTRKRLVIK